MKTNLNATGGWIIATFSLLALFLMSVTNDLAPSMKTDLANKKMVTTTVSADPFMGQIIMFGGNFAPRGWALCNGQLLPISSNTALFSLLGTTYGGDGRTTFALPDLRGRVPVHPGRGPGLAPYSLGQTGGTESVPFPPGVRVTSSTSGNVQVLNAGSHSSNLQPYATVNYIIALQGTYPSRS